MSPSPPDDSLRWVPHFPGMDSIWYLMRGTDELARVARRVDGAGWLSEVARHRPDARRRPFLIAPTVALAKKWAERWTRANWARTLTEIPPMRVTQCGTRTRALPPGAELLVAAHAGDAREALPAGQGPSRPGC